MQAPARQRWTLPTKFTVVLLLVGLGVFLLYQFRAAIRPFIVAAIIAYILTPLATWLQKRLNLRRIPAIFLAYVIAIILLVAIPLIVIPPLAAQSTSLNLDIQRSIQNVEALLGLQYTIAGYTLDLPAIVEQATGSVQSFIEPIFSQSLQFAMEALSSLVWIIFMLVVSFYLIKDGPALQHWLEELVPPGFRDDYIALRSEINLIWGAFFRGQLTLAIIVASILTTAGLIIGLPFALVMGVIGGLLEFLPSLGHGIWMVAAALLALLVGSTWLPIPNWAFALLVIGLHVFFQQFDLNYLIPRVIGRRVQLPPLVVILGIVTGALLGGVLGIFLAAPTIASARVLGRYVYANLLDQEPFASPVAPPLPPPNPRWWRSERRSEPERKSDQGS